MAVFLASVAVVLGGSLSRRVDVSVALGLGALLYGALALGGGVVGATVDAFNVSMFNVLVSLVFAMALGFLMRGRREAIAGGLVAVGPRFAAFSIPAAIGLLPMPGGAYISAVVADPLYGKMGMGPVEKTFLNYWMRHVWVSVWPLYQGVILTSAVLGVSVAEVAARSWPAALAAAVGGVAVGWRAVRRVGAVGRARDLAALWPLGLVAVLSFLLPLPAAVGLTLAAFVAVYRVGVGELAAAFKYALTPRILAIIVFSLVFSQYIRESGLSRVMADALGHLALFAVFLIPFLIGIATGVEFAFAGLAFPPLHDLLHGYSLAVGFLGGFLGVMLSPSHSCFVLTAEYYKADMRAVYKPLTKAALYSAAVLALLYLALTAVVS